MKERTEKEFQLIKGEFSPTDALKLLMSLLNSKINYHQLESFSNQIRFDTDISHSQKRVESLIASTEAIKEIIKEASENGKQLKIESVIQITLTD